MKPHLETGTHTPGPWLIKKRHDEPEYSNSILSVEADGKDFVDSVATLYGCEDPEKLANARLIAAAPTMYEFVKQWAEHGNAEAIAILENINGRS